MSDPKEWYCRTCHCVVLPEHVTNDETHDGRYGGCGAKVIFEDVPRKIDEPLNDGGPAFPCPIGHIECNHPSGMSLRDWFAGMAITGILANPNAMNIKITEAWKIADTILATREVKP